MNKAQLIEEISKKTKTTKVQTELFLDELITTIEKALMSGEEVKIVGFGVFSATKRMAKKGRNPKTGEKVDIPSAILPKFKPGKELKEKLQKKRKP